MIHKSFIRGFRDTIGYLLFKKIFFAYILFVLLFTSYQVYAGYTLAKKAVLKDMANAQNSFSSILATSIWHFDKKEIELNIDAIIESKTISGIAVLTPLDEVIQFQGTIDKSMKGYEEFVFEKRNMHTFNENLLIHHFNLIDHINSPDEILAKVYFYTQKDKILELAKEPISLILLNAVTSAFILWFLFLFFANRLLTIPLNQIIDATKELSTSDFHKVKIPTNKERKHELNTLANTFNKMSQRINEDFINLKQLNLITQKQKNDLVEANKSKDDFLANMSHELKTPLNSINVISSVMMKNKQNTLSEEQVKNLSIINGCGNDLLYLINDVLDISKLEAGEIELVNETLNFKETMLGIKEMFEPQVIEKKLEFIFEYDERIAYIYSDEQRIKQIIKNLLSNSIKFVHNGGIRLKVQDMDKNIKILVEDDGIGIDENKLEHIFDRFKQVDGSTTRKYGGTGLGLAICKDLALLLGGDITVKSTVNVGTVFTIILPKNSEKINQIQESEPISMQHNNSNDSNKLILLHNDPILYMGVIVDLKNSFEVIQVKTLIELVSAIKEHQCRNIILDMKGLSEDEVLKVASNIGKSMVIVCENKNQLSSELQSHAYTIMEKPFDKSSMVDILIQK